MDSDRIEGAVEKGTGKAKEEWGDLTDDTSTEAEGRADQVKGEVKESWGETKDEVRDTLDDDRA